jgi:hypothetical protein
MTAGRELDALIAEKVMGWRKRGNTDYGHLIPPGEVEEDRVVWPYPCYSTEIEAAWELVEKMLAEYGQEVRLVRFAGHGWSAEFLGLAGNPAFCTGTSAPHAICLAALAATRVPV